MRIDVHAHYWTEDYLDLLVDLGKADAGAARGLRAGGDAELAARLRLMDRAGVQMQVLSACPQTPYGGARCCTCTRPADTGADIRLLVHRVSGMLQAGRGRRHEALQEFSAAEYLGSQLADSHALAGQVTGWMLATQARLGMAGKARATIATLADERAGSGEIHNARAVICLAEGDPAGAIGALRDVLDGTAPVVGDVTAVEAQLLAGLAYRELGNQHAANQAAERALGLAEPDRLVLPFAMADSRELLEALPRHETAHAALLADILDVLHGASLPVKDQPPPPEAEELSPGELKVLQYLPTNLSRREIAGELSVSPSTVSTHIRSIYAKLGVRDRSSAVQRARELRLLGGRPHALARRSPDRGDA